MDQNESNTNPEEFNFIKEKIKEKPVNKKRLMKKIIWLISSAVLFGLIACITFVVARPKLEALMEPKEPESVVTIPRDEPLGTENIGSPEDPTGTENQDLPEEQEQVAPPQEPIYVERELEVEDYQMLQNKLYAIGKKGNRSIVTVTGVTSNVDWFDSEYERENQGSGVIIANTEQELLILTEKKVIHDAEEIEVSFINGDVVAAELKKYDENTGIAVLSVKLEDLAEETPDKIEVVALGNSYTVNQGTVVIAIGSPLGANYSILAGTVTSSNNTISMWDSTNTLFTTDIVGSAGGSGVLINLNGEVIGLVMQEYNSQGDRNIITALSISELKGVIEALSNGMAIPYLGVKVSTVTDEVEQEYGLPKGVFIKNISVDETSPAMAAGLQEGDIIVEMNGQEIKNVGEYTQTLLSLNPEQSVKIKVLRRNGEAYVELECTAVVGVLK